MERRVREERVMWEGRVRGLEARVRELEAKTGTSDHDDQASRPPNTNHNSLDAATAAKSATSASSTTAPAAEATEEVVRSRERSRSAASTQAEKKPQSTVKDDEEGDQLQDD